MWFTILFSKNGEIYNFLKKNSKNGEKYTNSKSKHEKKVPVNCDFYAERGMVLRKTR